MSDRTGGADAWYRNVPGRLGAGVCASLAAHFRWNVVVVRVAFVASLAITGGLACWVYLAFWALTPFNAGSKSLGQRLLGAIGPFFTTTVAHPSPPTTGSATDANVNTVE